MWIWWSLWRGKLHAHVHKNVNAASSTLPHYIINRQYCRFHCISSETKRNVMKCMDLFACAHLHLHTHAYTHVVRTRMRLCVCARCQIFRCLIIVSNYFWCWNCFSFVKLSSLSRWFAGISRRRPPNLVRTNVHNSHIVNEIEGCVRVNVCVKFVFVHFVYGRCCHLFSLLVFFFAFFFCLWGGIQSRRQHSNDDVKLICEWNDPSLSVAE